MSTQSSPVWHEREIEFFGLHDPFPELYAGQQLRIELTYMGEGRSFFCSDKDDYDTLVSAIAPIVADGGTVSGFRVGPGLWPNPPVRPGSVAA